MLQERFATDPLVQYLDLGSAVDLHDPTLAYDGMHMTPEGNQRIARRLADYLRSFLVARSN
jgi:lysophospholipase L1-like esterase